jgi:hypothetical protein
MRKNNSKTKNVIRSGSRYMSKGESQEWGRLTVRLVKSLGQAVDTNESELETRVRKINSKTIQIIRSGSRYKLVRVSVKSGED